MEWLTNPEVWIALATLTVLEVVLGVDNVIFISILASKLPKEKQDRARVVGISLAAVTRILFLLSIAWIMALKKPLFALLGHEITGKDLVLVSGGLFLIYKSLRLLLDLHPLGMRKGGCYATRSRASPLPS